MPIYDYGCRSCAGTFTKTLRISERATPLESPCPHCGETGQVEQRILTAPGIGDPVRMGVTTQNQKAGGFKEVLSAIHNRCGTQSKLDSFL